MKGLRVSLKAGERLYINGAVLRPDRKVSIELLNEVTFLLEQHVIKPEDATTPLRQLYFIVQTLLMDPSPGNPAREMCRLSLSNLCVAFSNEQIREGLASTVQLVDRERFFDALREIRKLLSIEAAIIAPSATDAAVRKEIAHAD